MRYIVGIFLSIILYTSIHKFLPEANPLTPFGFMIYSPVLFIIFWTFYKELTNEEANDSNTQSCKSPKQEQVSALNSNPNNSEINHTDNSDLLPHDFTDEPLNKLLSERNLYDFAIENFPTGVTEYCKYDHKKYSRLIILLQKLSIYTLKDLKTLYNETKDIVREQDKKQVEEKLHFFHEKTSELQDAEEYTEAEVMASNWVSLKRAQTLLWDSKLFKECLCIRFTDTKSKNLIQDFLGEKIWC